MEYERIQPKPSSQGGGISPSKLRLMLLGVEKKRKEEEEEEEEEEELESRSALRYESSSVTADIDDHCDSVSESYKDVDIVTATLPPESSTFSKTTGTEKSKDLASQRTVRSQDEDCTDSDSGVSSGVFEFQRAERASHRSTIVPFTKPAPSKWDDAQKWIASPTSNRQAKGGGGGVQTKRMGLFGYGNRPKVVVEVGEEFETKRVDRNLGKKDSGGQKVVSLDTEPFPVPDTCTKPAVFVDCLASDSAIHRSQHGSTTSIQSDTTVVAPPSTVRSVSMRDMGTEMTPIASQEPSRTGTPVRATTPIRSPISSTPSSPGRNAPNLGPAESIDCLGDDNRRELTEQELKLKTRREIMALGTKLGKTNIAAWASKDEVKDSSAIRDKVPEVLPGKKIIEIRAAAWEEAEKAKFLARFKREEIKIQAWENHENAKAEAEMRKTEVEVERTRAHAHDRLVNKLAATRRKAQEKLAMAEARRNRQATRAAQQADFIRKTGQVPPSFTCWSWCS